MLRIMREKTIRDGIKKQTICETTGVKIEEAMREQRLRWLGHVVRIDDRKLPSVKAKYFKVGGSNKGRLNKRWKERVEKDMLEWLEV